MTTVARTIAVVREAVAKARAEGLGIGLVPTMGALHEGHRSLIRAARGGAGCVVVSLFVNPTQFGPGEDYERYPRPFEADLETCRDEGVDILFAPSVEAMYPGGERTTIHVAGLSEVMCGPRRPGHFDGVATVVAKLLNIVGPDAAWFGEKDAQQLAIIRRMVADLDFPVAVHGCPTVREPDGLALSSRNAYLSAEERRRALILSAALAEARQAVEKGCRDGRQVADLVRRRIESEPGVDLEYVAVADPDTLEPLEQVGERVLVAVAARVGRTRLIDNVRLAGLTGEREKA